MAKNKLITSLCLLLVGCTADSRWPTAQDWEYIHGVNGEQTLSQHIQRAGDSEIAVAALKAAAQARHWGH